MASTAFRTDRAWQSAALAHSYLAGVRGAIPLAATQIDILLRVIHAFQPTPSRWLDLGCGDGVLGRALLAEFPDSFGIFADFSEPMLQAARQAVGGQPHVEFVTTDFGLSSWVDDVVHRGPFDVVVSGYAIHHQPDERKQQVYAELYELLAPGGVFLNLEHVSSCDRQVEHLFDELFIDALHTYSQAQGGDRSRDEVANEHYYRPDKAANILAPLDRQCHWLQTIGFQHVDCFFKLFEMALFGGVRPSIDSPDLLAD